MEERVWINDTPHYLNQKLKLFGWVHNRRDHGKIIFIDLRDRTGIVQLVFTPNNQQVYENAQKLRSEWVIEVEGKVNERPKEMINPKIATGSIEIEVENLKILSQAKTLPIDINSSGKEISEELRLKYRYLDLRRERMRENIIDRFRVVKFIRDFYQKRIY